MLFNITCVVQLSIPARFLFFSFLFQRAFTLVNVETTYSKNQETRLRLNKARNCLSVEQCPVLSFNSGSVNSVSVDSPCKISSVGLHSESELATCFFPSILLFRKLQKEFCFLSFHGV